VSNPIDRSSLSGRSGLVPDTDGSIDIVPPVMKVQ
jgi:hypothetical protein